MRKVQVPPQYFEVLVGRLDENLKTIEKALQVKVSARGNEIFIDGEDGPAQQAEVLVNKLLELQEGGYTISSGDVKTASGLLQQNPDLDLKKFFLNSRVIPSTKKNVFPKSFNQKRYI